VRPGAATQTGRLLALLELGGWWSTRDLLSEVPSVVHSRISDLRAKGYDIEHKTTGEGAPGSFYRLNGFHGVAPSAEDAEGGTSADVPEGLPSLPLGQEGVGAAAAPSDSQLALDVPGEHMYRRDAA